MAGVGQRTQQPVAPVDDQVVVEVLRSLQQHQERLPAVVPQQGGGEHRALEAVRRAPAQHFHRPVGRSPVRLEVVGYLARQEVLDLLGGVELLHEFQLGVAQGDSEFIIGKQANVLTGRV